MSFGKANLTYYIYEGVLAGHLNKKFILYAAQSGGGGMSKLGLTNPAEVNNPFYFDKKTEYKNKEDATKENRGGPIPPGNYRILKPEPWGESKKAVLEPVDFTKELLKKIGRNGFLIHARGNYGSDGCIVPNTWEAYVELMEGLEADNGGKLKVCLAMSEDRIKW